jgi:hypothetical protein
MATASTAANKSKRGLTLQPSPASWLARDRAPVAKAPRRLYYRNLSRTKEVSAMAESVYKIIELVGTSTESWEAAARAAVERASSTLRDLRIAEVDKLDMTVDNNKVALYRAKIKLSFKYEEG